MARSLLLTQILVAVAGLAGVAWGENQEQGIGFEKVTILMPMNPEHLKEPVARELADIVFLIAAGSYNEVGKPITEAQAESLREVERQWHKPGMSRTSVGLKLARGNGKKPISLAGVSNPAEGVYDYANRKARQQVADGLYITAQSVPTKWMFIDEPCWSFSGLVDAPQSLPISTELKEQVEKLTGQKEFSVECFEKNRDAWRSFVIARNQAFADTLSQQCLAMKRAGQLPTVNFFPAAIESGAVTACEIPRVMRGLAGIIDVIQIDPYYTCYAENPRYAGFMLRMLDEVTPTDIPILGWVDSVDAIGESFGVKNPPPRSMATQIASYLANGSDHLGVWAYIYLKRLRTLDSFVDTVRWVRKHNELFSGNPRSTSGIGLYFSSPTFHLKDFFPKAWTHGTGPFGQYFDVLHAYYSTVCSQIPVRVVSTELGREQTLAEKLDELDVLIVVNAVVMTDSEIRDIDQWARDGGTLIAVGPCGVEDDRGNKRASGLGAIGRVKYTAGKKRAKLVFESKGIDLEPVAVSGSNHELFVDTYLSNLTYAKANPAMRYDYGTKWPLYVRDEPISTAKKIPPARTALGTPQGIGFVADKGALVLAKYDDGDAAVVEVSLGKGRAIYVGPIDLASNNYDISARNAFASLIRRAAAGRLPTVNSAGDLASVELNILTKTDGKKRIMIAHMINHVEDDQFIIAPKTPLKEITLELPLPAGWSVSKATVYSFDRPAKSLDCQTSGQKVRFVIDQLKVYCAVVLELETAADNL